MKYDSVGPYTGIEFDATREVAVKGGTRHFRIVAYEAYNAFGLFGPEKNGVAVLDEDHRTVVTDEIARVDSGYCGLPATTLAEARSLCEALDADFIRRVGASPRLRSPGWLKGEY